MIREGIWESSLYFQVSESSPVERVSARLSRSGLWVKSNTFEREFFIGEFRIRETHPNGDILFDFPILKREYGTLPFARCNDSELLNLLNTYGYTRKGDYIDLGFKPAIAIGISIILFIVLFFTLGIDWISLGVAELIPQEAEEALGKAAYEQVSSEFEIDTSFATKTLMSKCEAFVGSLSPDSSRHFKIVIAEKNIKNAFALPGGTIVVYRGILKEMEREPELLGLLAHEAGHIYRKHSLKKVARASLFLILYASIFGDVTGLSAILIQQAGGLLDLSYSRADETEADEFAVTALKSIGYDISGLATLFKKIKNTENALDWGSFLSTHPSPEARIAYFEKEASLQNVSGKRVLTEEEWQLLMK